MKGIVHSSENKHLCEVFPGQAKIVRESDYSPAGLL